jgi:hypothetical protein
MEANCPNCGTTVTYTPRTTAERSAASKDRLYAQRKLVDGRWVAPVHPDQHGSMSTYTNRGCRCWPCTEAMRVHDREYKARKRAS